MKSKMGYCIHMGVGGGGVGGVVGGVISKGSPPG